MQSKDWKGAMGYWQWLVVCTWMLLLPLQSLFAEEGYGMQDIELESGTSLTVNVFASDGESLVLWLPSERGTGSGLVPVALGLADRGHEVWVADLHESYMVPKGRTSLDDMPVEDMVLLLEEVKTRGFKTVALAADSRGAQLALKLATAWDEKHADSTLLSGFLFAYPHLISGAPEMGEDADYLPLARTALLPVYYLQPQFSPKYVRSEELAEILRSSGAQVFVHKLPGVQGGFHMRPLDHLTDTDIEQKEKLPGYYSRAIAMLQKLPRSQQKAVVIEEKAGDPVVRSRKEARLYPFKGDPKPPPLKLENLEGKQIDLADYQGEVVLVNFWATWCGPCVEEIPSLGRLVEKMGDKPFKVLTVNIGEPREQIEEFLEKVKADFPILLDTDGQTVRDWKVYAYPSNFLIDRRGVIRYAYRGALEWDAEEIIDTIKDTILDSAPTAYASQ